MKYNRISRKGSHIFLLWLISYVSVLVVPMIISVILYIFSDNVISGEINKANEASMSQLQQIIDDNLKNIKKISIDIGWDDKVVSYMRTKEPLNPLYKSTMVEIIRNMKLQVTSNKLINFSYIYFKNSNSILSTNASNDIKDVYEFYHKSEKFLFEDWKKLIEGIHTWDYKILSRVVNVGKTTETIAFMQTLPVEYPSMNLGNVVILVDKEQFSNILSEVKWVEDNEIFILDKNSDIIASTSEIKLPPKLNYDRLKEDGKLINERIGDEDVIITHIDSAVSDWKYVSMIPKAVFLKKAKYVRNLTLLGIFFCLIIGGAVAYFMAKRNYNPVKKILETLVNRAGIAFNQDINEFDFINQSIELTVEQKESISEKLKNQYGILKSNYILKLLTGKISDGVSLEEAMTSYNIEFSSEYFAVMMFLIEDIRGFIEKAGEKDAEDGIKLARRVIANVAQELIEQSNKVFVVEVDEAVACIINFSNKEEHYGVEELECIAVKVKEVLQNEFRIFFTGSISSIHETVYGISQAYHEALEALEYKLVVGTGNVISYHTIKEVQGESNSYEFTLAMQQKFMNCIKAEDFDGARKIMDDVIDSSLLQVSIPIAMAKCLMFAIVNTMVNAVKELSIVCDREFLEKLNPVERLLKCKTVKDMKYEMKSILRSVEEYIATSKEEVNNNLIPKLKQFIEKEYKDSNMNISTISNIFNMNPAYLSRYFKMQTGEGLLDYINRLRLEKAKQLLKKTNTNINEIAELVGYYNSNAFIRSFKKYEGITPGKYRELK